MRALSIVVLAVLAGGCGKAHPTLAGGKPVEYWVQALHDPDPKTRKTAASKLGNVGPADPAVFPALQGALQDSDAGVRCAVILALLKCGPQAREAVPVLTQVCRQDRDAQVRDYATKALQKIQGDKSPFAP